MAPKIFTVCGVAGAAKTTFGINLVQSKLREGLRWDQIGYSSFSRAACSEAARRASEVSGISIDQLQRHGFFATMHSLSLRATGIDRKCILDHDSADGKKFITEACGAPPDARERGTLSERVGQALAKWDLFRATLGYRLHPLSSPPESSTSSGFIHHDRGGARSVITLCPGHNSLHYNGLDENSGINEYGPARRKSDGVSPLFPAFFSAKACFLDSVSRIEKILNNENHASINFDSNAEKFCHSGSIVSNPLCAHTESAGQMVMTDILPNPSPNTSGCEKTSVFEKSCATRVCQEPLTEVIQNYERAKNLYGRLDFTDILLAFLGVSFDLNLELVRTFTSDVNNGVHCWVFDEHQDVSPLLACVAEKLSETAQEVNFLGDDRQAIYAFSGSSGAILRAYDDVAKENGTSTLLNTSFRNPIEVVEWGEAVLNEDPLYESRQPVSEAWEEGEVGVFREGSVGLVSWDEFLAYLPDLVLSDVLILSRAWFSLLPVKERLDSLGVPWRSCQEKQSSRWECPAKIAYTLAMRALSAGELISEQDWRRITDTLPQKMDGIELFIRGTKAKWKKIVCSPTDQMTIGQLDQWGATPEFFDFVMNGLWRREMPLLLDNAIDKYGIDVVRNPRIRLGSVHSVKGLEARNVFCLSASTERCSGADADFQEEICLKYVAITRSAKNYRLVVNKNDIARSKPQFWAAPKGFWEFTSGSPDGHYSEPRRREEEVGSEDPSFDSQVDDFEFRL